MLDLKKAILVGLFAVLAACGGREPTEPTEPPPPPELSTYAPDGKLPGDARPQFYDVHMQIDPRKKVFTGEVLIAVELDADSSGFWLHGDDLRISSIEVNAAGAPEQKSAGTWEEVLESGVARIGFAKNFGPGVVDVRIQYEANFDENLAGLFRVEEQGEAYALAKSESIQARRYLPSFDEPGYKAPFDIVLDIPGDMIAISNTPVLEEFDLEGDVKTVRFAKTRPLPTYLLSLAVGPFDVVDAGVLPPNDVRAEPIPLRGITRKGRGANIARAMDVTPRLVEIFETELRQPYPYKKLDIVAAPAWPSGATELAGAITYRESRILLNEQSGPSAERDMLRIHSHELGHMWFGNLVTPPWWDDLWLKEAFATWGTPVSLSKLEPDEGHALDAVVRGLSAMSLDSLASTRAVREPIERNADIRNAYDSITYSKGMAVIRMMDEYFGPDKFRPALGKYVEAFEDGVADSPAFFGVIGTVSGEPRLTEAFESFVEQTGVPVITLTPLLNLPGEHKIGVRQERYAPLGSAVDPDQLWTIPFCLRIQGGEEPLCHILDARSMQIDIGDSGAAKWIMPNAGAGGYFRFNMPGSSWSILSSAFDELTVAEQLATIDSAVASFEAGELDPLRFFELLEVAANAIDRRVVTAPTSALGRYAGMLEGEDLVKFRGYVASIYKPLLQAASQREDKDGQILHGALTGFLAFTVEDEEIRANSVHRARRFLGLAGEPDPTALYSDEYRDAFILLVQDGGPDDFFALADAADARDDARFQLAAVAALGAARDAELATTARLSLLDGAFGPRESFGLLTNQMNDPATQEDAWIWLQANFAAFVDKIPRQWPRRTPRLASGFCDVARVSELQEMFRKYGELAPGHEAALAQTIERIQLCSALKSAKMKPLVQSIPYE